MLLAQRATLRETLTASVNSRPSILPSEFKFFRFPIKKDYSYIKVTTALDSVDVRLSAIHWMC